MGSGPMWLLRSISLPHLTRHRVRTALTLLGIAIGVGAVVATTSVTEGVFRSFRHTVEATAGRAQLQLSNGRGGVREDLLDEIRGVPGVAGAAALIEGFVGLSGREGESLAIYGLDLLGDEEHEAQVPRTAVHVPDDVLFVSQPDSVALARTFADARGYEIGSTIEVVTPAGPRRLVVRGLVDAAGPAALFGGMVGLMDLPAAQRLLAKEGIVDRIDVRLAPDASRDAVLRELDQRVHGEGRVESITTAGARAEDLLFSVRVALCLAGLIAVVVGFFLIYHTVAVSIMQRRKEIALLSAMGYSGWTILAWLTLEALILAAVAVVCGLAIGVVLGRLSMATFGGVVSAWLTLPAEQATLTGPGVILAVTIGVATTLAATLAPAWSLTSAPAARYLRLAPTTMPPTRSAAWALGAASVGLLGTTALLYVAPRGLPYGPLVTFIFAVNCLALVSFALLAPAVALVLGRLTGRVAEHLPGVGLLVASGNLARRPAAPTAVVAAIVTGVGWTLAFSSLVTSLEHSWLGWLDQSFQSDLIVSAGTASVSLLTYPPVREEIADDLRTVPGVREVQAIRSVEGDYGGRPIVLMAIDPATQGLPLVDGAWPEVAPAFWQGRGIVISENLAHKTGLRKGDPVTLPTPSGSQLVPVLGTFEDFQNGGDLGCVAMSREIFGRWWEDHLITRMRVWLAPGADLATVRRMIEGRYGQSHGLHALTFAEARAGVADLVRSCFSISYALVLIAMAISLAGVINFLLAAVLDRSAELRTLAALGVTTRQIVRMIVSEGGLIGAVGACIGVLAGIAISRIIVLHSVPMVNGWHFTWRFPLGPPLALVGAVVVLACGAGLLPARMATRRSVFVEVREQ